MNRHALQSHGRAILETAKDHLADALNKAPEEGWTAVEWAEAAGLLLDDAKFPAVFAHHLGPVLVAEGRALLVGEQGLAHFVPARRKVREPETVQASATAAPEVWGATRSAAGVEERHAERPPSNFPAGVADEEEGPPPDGSPWIP
jgi:hypothetical protein